jgi:hypothetical protein
MCVYGRMLHFSPDAKTRWIKHFFSPFEILPLDIPFGANPINEIICLKKTNLRVRFFNFDILLVAILIELIAF